jgi:hypothetical protein
MLWVFWGHVRRRWHVQKGYQFHLITIDMGVVIWSSDGIVLKSYQAHPSSVHHDCDSRGSLLSHRSQTNLGPYPLGLILPVRLSLDNLCKEQLRTAVAEAILRGNLFPLPARQILGTSCWHVAIGEQNAETKPHKPTNGHVTGPKILCFYIVIYSNRDMLTELHGFDS